MNCLTRSILVVAACSCIVNPVELLAGEPGKNVQENLNRLIETKRCPECNLQGVNLNRADLSGSDLQGADLTGAKLYLCNLSGANLQNAILRNTGFGGADLADADLRGADLSGTSLGGAYTSGTKFDSIGVSENSDEIDLDSIIESGREAGSPLAAVEFPEIETGNVESVNDESFIDPATEIDEATLKRVKADKSMQGIFTASKAAPQPKRVVPMQSVTISNSIP